MQDQRNSGGDRPAPSGAPADNENDSVRGKESEPPTSYQLHPLDPAIIRTVRLYAPGNCTQAELREHLRKNKYLTDLDARLHALEHVGYCSTIPGKRKDSLTVILTSLPYPVEYQEQIERRAKSSKLIVDARKLEKLLKTLEQERLAAKLPEDGREALLTFELKALNDELTNRIVTELAEDPQAKEIAALTAENARLIERERESESTIAGLRARVAELEAARAVEPAAATEEAVDGLDEPTVAANDDDDGEWVEETL